ncbi:LacI family DNA-binding transcriptional regulator [Micromonospora sp. SH-82]|uniref:LacI family DNA-binding transcriptional regulator n=1 Tax=Micromonospora sp. SH-82 TaxID=3132938 RepID=UPI003EC04C9D
MSRSKPTIDDVAQVAGVSRATASRVINDAPGASDPVRARVHDAVSRLGYRPNQSARALASGRQRAVDVLAVTYGPVEGWLGVHPYYSRVLAGMMSVLEAAEVPVRLHTVNGDATPDTIDTIAANATVGAVLATVTPTMAARFHRRCPRAVSLVATAPSVPAIEADNTAGAYRAVAHLHALGRRRIAAIHGPATNPCAIDRHTGYRRAVDNLGLPNIGAHGDFLRAGGHRAALRLLDEHPDIDAIFVACDLMAAGAVQAITSTGRRIPHDIQVVGFDDSIAAVCANPPLSTMRLPVEEMAATATRLLLTGDVPSGHRQRFTVELVERDSTGRLAT